MDHMDYFPLTAFKSLRPKEQRRFNEKLNEYIKELPEDKCDWNAKMQDDFNEVCVREIFTEDFDPSKVPVYTGAYKEEQDALIEEEKVREEQYRIQRKEVEDVWKANQETEEEITE